MENENLTTPGFQGTFIQLALFLGLVATWLIPAFLFKNVAKRYNKKGWIYFIIGLGVGMLTMSITAAVMQGVRDFIGAERALPYLIGLFFILPFLFIYMSLRFLKFSFTRS